MKTRFAALKADYDRGVIDRDSFVQKLNELCLQDATGTWWQLGEDGESWLKWDGSQWVAFS